MKTSLLRTTSVREREEKNDLGATLAQPTPLVNREDIPTWGWKTSNISVKSTFEFINDGGCRLTFVKQL